MAYQNEQKGNYSNIKVTSRRRLLKAGGAAALATGFAGCMGGTSDSRNGSGGPQDPAFTGFADSGPTNRHFNPYNPVQWSIDVASILQNHLWKYNPRIGEWRPRISNDFSLDGTTATIGIDSSYKWANGMSVTATDFVKQLQIEKYIEKPIWDHLSSIRKVDKTTIELKLKNAYNKAVLRNLLNRLVVVRRDSEWEQWLDRFRDASGNQKKLGKVQDDLRTWTYAVDSGDPVLNGPYVVESRSESEWVLTQNEHFPYETNIQKYKFQVTNTEQNIWQLAISDRLDGAGHFSVTKAIAKKIPDHIKHYTLPITVCSAPAINFTRSPWDRREARQALAYLLDRELLVKNSNPSQSVIHQTTGLPDAVAKQFLTDRHRKPMAQYGTKSKPKQAAERMRAAGLGKRNGKWKMDDGTTVSLELMSAQWPVAQGMSQTLEQLLPEFGIEFISTLVDEATWSTRRSKGQYGLTHYVLKSKAEPTPWPYYNGVIQNPMLRKQAGHPQQMVKLPPIGKPNGPLQTINLQKVVQKLLTANNKRTLKKLTAQAAWYINQLLPVIPALNTAITATISTDDWTFPPIDADLMGMRNPSFQLLKEPKDDSNKSVLQAKTE